jgi:hypothetical protein
MGVELEYGGRRPPTVTNNFGTRRLGWKSQKTIDGVDNLCSLKPKIYAHKTSKPHQLHPSATLPRVSELRACG